MGFLFFFFLFLLVVVVVVGVVESRRRGIVFNTAGAGGEDSSLVSVCVGKEDEFALHCRFTHSKGVKGLREERASSQRSHRVAQRKADVSWNEDEV